MDVYGKDWRELRIASYDFETTGVNAKEDRVTEMGVIIFEGGEPISSFCSKFNPQKPQKKKAAAVSGITDEELAKEGLFADKAQDIKKLMLGCDVWVAFNEAFDRSFLAMEFKKAGIYMPAVATIDPLIWAHFFWPGGPNNLDNVSQRLKVNLSHDDRSHLVPSDRERHSADYDSMLTARCLFAMAAIMPQSLRQTLYTQDWLYRYWLVRIKNNEKKYARALDPILPPEAYEEKPEWLDAR